MPTILFVDDEPNILYGYERALWKDYDIGIAESTPDGLVAIENAEPVAVIVADMRMLVVNSVQFLALSREIS